MSRSALIVLPLLLAACSEFDLKSIPSSETVTTTDTPATTPPPGPALEITPAVFEFGSLNIPCEDATELTLTSVGDADVTITQLDYTSNGLLALDDSGLQLPVTLSPGESTTVMVTAVSTDEITDYGQLTVTSDDVEGPDVADQVVTAEPLVVQEVFTEPGIPPVDVLFLIDQSCSMQALADDNIRSGMPAFVAELQSVADWQLIQVTTSDGCANGGVMDSTTPDAATLLADNAFNVFFAGVYTEQLLKHAEKALSLTDPGECNAGFLRPGASLHILVASDEAESSLQSWSYWRTQYEGFVTNPALVKVSGILNLFSNDVCSDGNGGSPDGYIDIVNATGGVALDICAAGWGSQLTSIASATVAGIRVYNLTDNAVEGTVEVTVNGVPATDYVFVNATNSVQVNAPLIEEGDVVEVTYEVDAVCVY
ncbi:MAG: hypothetical protein GWP91_20770 [Rhodobacterales bacterium]|nr:hypothetical protein [Rhodobacterales bacterium]